MTELAWLTLINGILAFLGTALGAYLTYKMQVVKAQSVHNGAKVDEIRTIVDGQRSALEAKIARLQAELRRERGEPQ